jgi:hypothetical protein
VTGLPDNLSPVTSGKSRAVGFAGDRGIVTSGNRIELDCRLIRYSNERMGNVDSFPIFFF